MEMYLEIRWQSDSYVAYLQEHGYESVESESDEEGSDDEE